MKIERINENQIRCTLTSADFIQRQIRISELAFGTEKAKQLLQEMMEQAQEELGFNAENIPLMIEAIPAKDSIVLVITKIDTPDVLDRRMPKYSGIPQEMEDNLPIGLEEESTSDENSPFGNLRIFCFQDLDFVIRAAHVLNGVYEGANSLYKDPETMDYLLVLTRSSSKSAEFHKVCNLLAEYSIPNISNGATLAFLEEHCDLIISSEALQVLASL